MTAAFVCGHAAHRDGMMALALAAAQITAASALQPGPFAPTLGFLYLTDTLAAQAETVLADVQRRWPGITVAGCVGVGIAASGVEYFDEPALVLMLASLPRQSFRPFSGRQPLPGDLSRAALLHADPTTPDLAELVTETGERAGYLFGGLASSRQRHLHWAGEVFEGGLSGIAFEASVALLSRVTQGCQPVGPSRRITASQRNLVLSLDGQPALQCLAQDLQVSLDRPAAALPRLRATLAGLTSADDAMLGRGGQFGPDTRVRHLIGVDAAARAVALADWVEPGMQLAFCQRNVDAARRDLVRICTEIREEVEARLPLSPAPSTAPQPNALPMPDGTPRSADAAMAAAGVVAGGIAGAIYVSCTGRGGAHFGAPSAELQIVQRALGDVPLAGFFASGEVARNHLYGYTGVLTVFLS